MLYLFRYGSKCYSEGRKYVYNIVGGGMFLWLKSNVVLKFLLFLLLLVMVFIVCQFVQVVSVCVGVVDCKVQVLFIGEYLEDICEVSIDGGFFLELVLLLILLIIELKIDKVEVGKK